MDAPLVTGIGCVSALGLGRERYWSALTSGQSGVKEISTFEVTGLRSSRAGAIELTPAMQDEAQRYRIPSRLELFATLALDEALADAGLERGSLKSRRVALIAGTSLGMSLVAPDLSGRPLPSYSEGASGGDLSAFADALARRYGLEGRTLMVSTACASSTHALCMARDMILEGEYDVVLAGGADTLDRMKYLGHTALGTLTPGAPKPFTEARDGTLFGEGAAFLVLERTSPSRRHYATCCGGGFSTDIHHLTAPDPQGRGAILSMQAAITDAGLHADQIDHVNLHGSGTDLNDTAEALAVQAVFGERARRLPCTSIKPAIGHTMGAAGALEAVATVLSVHTQQIPRTLNVSAPEVALGLEIVSSDGYRNPIRYALSNSFGFGGANGTVVFGRPGESTPEGKP